MKLKLILALVASCSMGLAATWEIDGAHSSAHFKVRHMTVSNVNGEITGIKGTFTIDDKDASKVAMEGSLDMKTINTSNVKRDEHLKAEDFFDVKKFPTAVFKSKKVTKGEGDKLTLVGDLTLKEFTKEVTIEGELTSAVKDPWGNMRRGFSGTTRINRKLWGVTWNKVLDNGGLAVADYVDVTLEMEITPVAKNKKS